MWALRVFGDLNGLLDKGNDIKHAERDFGLLKDTG